MSSQQLQGASASMSVRSKMIQGIDFYIHRNQRDGKIISGYELFKELPNQTMLVNEEYLKLILAKANEAPESWQGLNLFAWKGLGALLPLGQQVPYFFYEAGEWKENKKWLGDNFGINDVAVVIGKVIEEDEPDLSPYDHNAIHNITENKRGVLV